MVIAWKRMMVIAGFSFVAFQSLFPFVGLWAEVFAIAFASFNMGAAAVAYTGRDYFD